MRAPRDRATTLSLLGSVGNVVLGNCSAIWIAEQEVEMDALTVKCEALRALLATENVAFPNGTTEARCVSGFNLHCHSRSNEAFSSN